MKQLDTCNDAVVSNCKNTH